MEPEEVEEEEDLDFVPFLREDIPSDGSSGLTSENEGAGPAPTESPLVDVNNNNRDSGLAEGLSGQAGPTTGLSIGEEEDDAICKRTRARFSLENYSLDELEAFLQESDEDGEGANVDEEEEYRRFLAAVLTDELPYNTEEVGVADEDENDADFELEIEEALESEPDEPVDNTLNETQARGTGAHRRPETRQKKRMKESSSDNHQSHLAMGLMKTAPLRPLVPYVTHTQTAVASPPTVPGQLFGFTAQQIGQLYVMLHEHVQLLVQVFSISVLDPGRQQVTGEIQNLIKEMVVKREEALTGKRVAHQVSCFLAPHLCSTVSCNANGKPESITWMPSIDGPIFSVLDVMPLRLAKDYLEDVAASVIRYRRSHLESTEDKSYTKREPLFPMPITRSTLLADNGSGISSMTGKGQQQPKKTLAATLVEGSMKQTIALVPADIARLAKRFYSLFNWEMLPHKPPVSAVANRVLFTDAEDRLLAMGLMDYNTDWEAIQKHYLPCKSTHQIFVRQKNRCSSKAPDNPIKVVRRMKTAPLGPDEIKQIQEGLKLYKNDWSLVWKLVVPHRDPSLLPRQWRVAMGTQKSYAKNQVIKEKRRKYEAKRRKEKALMANSRDVNTEEENEIDEGLNEEYENDNNAYEEEAYVHEAFLADSEHRDDPNTSSIPQEVTGHSTSNLHNNSQSIAPIDTRFSTSNSTSKESSSLPLPNRRKKVYKVVKLAPDLPPVNLPPSVRVISRARFNTSQTPAANDTTLSKVEPPKQLNLFPDSTQHSNSQTEAEFQMHPLLFQMTPDQQLSLYRPIATRPMNDNSSSGYGEFCKEVSGDSRTIAVHPLLQRISTDKGFDSQRNCCTEREREDNNLDLNIRLYSSPCGANNSTLMDSVDANVGANLQVGNAFCLEQSTVQQEAQNSSGYLQTEALMINEDSIQGIVMEQEELSDSEDGGDDSEHVEFECEEMADSDDERSPVLETLVCHSEKNHPIGQRDASVLVQGLNQANSRRPKQKKESRKDGGMQNKTELKPRKGRGRETKVNPQSDPGTSNRPVSAPRKPRKGPVLK